jgi:hypothetical protein
MPVVGRFDCLRARIRRGSKDLSGPPKIIAIFDDTKEQRRLRMTTKQHRSWSMRRISARNKTWSENEAYDLKSKTWFTLAPMPQTGSHGFGATVVGPNLVGGSTLPGGSGLSDQLLTFTLP